MQSLWMLVASLSFAVMGMFIKLATDANYSPAEVVFFRNAVAFILMASVVWRKRRQWFTPHWRFQAQRSISGFTAVSLYFYSISLLPLATAVTLNYSSSLFLAVYLIMAGKQKLYWKMVLALLTGFAGVVVLLHPTFASEQLPGVLIALASAVAAGFAAYNVRELGERGEPPWRTVLYFSLFSTVCSSIWVSFTGFHTITLQGASFLLGVGVFATIGQLTMTMAYQRGKTLVVASLGYSTVVFASILGVLVWREKLAADVWIAMVLIIASALMTNMFSRADDKIVKA